MEPRTYTSEYRDLVALYQAQGEELKKCREERDKARATLSWLVRLHQDGDEAVATAMSILENEEAGR